MVQQLELEDRLRKLRLGDVACRRQSTGHPADRCRRNLNTAEQKKVKVKSRRKGDETTQNVAGEGA